MKPQSAKAKGRNLQKLVVERLLAIGAAYGLEADDVLSRSMGAAGTDVILSPAARRLFGALAIECKNKETLNVVTTFHEHADKYKGQYPLLVHKRNRTEPLVTLLLDDYLELLKKYLLLSRGVKQPGIPNG